jgi:uncharacterized membrane protein YqjE
LVERFAASRPLHVAAEVGLVRNEALEPLSIQELIRRLIGNFSSLADKEMQLARAEAKQEAKRRGLAVGLLGGGLTFLFLALVSIIVAIILALSLILPGWLAAIIVAAVLAIIGGLVAFIGSRLIAKPLMQRTVHSLKEDVEWAKTLNNSSER